MNSVPPERLELIERWNDHAILIPEDQSALLHAIGRTPPDQYGNGRQFNETPCAVTTLLGEQIDLAIVSIQHHAPFEYHRNYRLAADIASLRPSSYALPLAVRAASSRADEIRMGFAPTLIETSAGELLCLNWTQNFLVRKDYEAANVRVSTRRADWANPPPIYDTPKDIVYFIADGYTAGNKFGT